MAALSKKQLGLKIKALRDKAGLTQPQLAAKLGVVPSCVCDWERGFMKPRVERLPKLASILGVDVNELVEAA